MYNVFDRSFNLMRTSKDHLQSYMWVLLSISQKVTCFFKRSTCSYPFFQSFWVNSPFQLQPSILRYLLVSRHIYFERKSVIWRHHLKPSIFSTFLFQGGTWSNPLCHEHFVYFTMFISQHFLQPSIIITSDLWLIQGNLKIGRVLCLFEEINCSPAFLF